MPLKKLDPSLFVPNGEQTLDDLVKIGSESISHHARRKTIRPYPSQASCQRKLVLESNWEGESVSDITFSLYTQIGVVVEKYLKQAWEKSGKLLASSFKLPENSLDIGGEIDAIVNLNGVPTIIEVKTCDSLPLRAKNDHYYQALTYSAVTGLPFSIYYMSRNIVEYKPNKTLKTVQFDYRYSEKESLAQTLQIAKALTFGKAGYIPPIPSHLSAKSHCGYCRFTDYCWGDGELSEENYTVEKPGILKEIELEKEALIIASDFNKQNEVLKRKKQILKLIGWKLDKSA